MRQSVLLAAVAVLAFSGCGGSQDNALPPLAPPLERTALPDLTHRDRDLTTDALAADAIDRERLEEVLRNARYEGGREREFTGHTDTVDHVVARVLRFETAEGAEAYLQWLDAHTLDVVGETRPLDPLAVGAAARLHELEPCSTCKKQLPTLLAAWRRDATVGTLLASGRGLHRIELERLVRSVDATLSKSTM